MKALGIGQCALDLLAVVDPYPEADEKVDVLEWDRQGGGPTATALATLAKLGVPCAYVGVIGSDLEGQQILDSLRSAQVDVSGVKVSPQGESQLSFIAVEKRTGKRTIFCRRSATLELLPQDIPASAFDAASILLLDGAMEEVSIHSAKKARELGIPVILDAGRLRSRTLELIRYCDFVVGSELFARQIGWTGQLSSFRQRARDLDLPVLTLTFGDQGSVTFTREAEFVTPAYAVSVVDTTGAGDVFHGAYAYGVLKEWPLEKTLRFASAAAALKCTRLGGRAGLPELSAVLSQLQNGQERSSPFISGLTDTH